MMGPRLSFFRQGIAGFIWAPHFRGPALTEDWGRREEWEKGGCEGRGARVSALGLTDPSCGGEEGGAGRSPTPTSTTERTHPLRHQFLGPPSLPHSSFPRAGSSHGNCCLCSGRPATCVPGIRLGCRAGTFLDSGGAGWVQCCPLLKPGKGVALDRGPTVGPENWRHLSMAC